MTRSHLDCLVCLGVLSLIPGCPESDGPPGGNNNGNGAGGVTADWFESWETAPLGPKENEEMFEADTGPWVVRREVSTPTGLETDLVVAANGSWTGAEVAILDGDRLFIRSHAAYLGGISDWSAEALVTTLPSDPAERLRLPPHLLDSIGFPLTTDTTFSGMFDCEIRALTPSDYGVITSATIMLTVGVNNEFVPIPLAKFVLIYWHENTLHPVLDAASSGQLPILESQLIQIPDQFERNIYDDLVAVSGDSFVDFCRVNQCIILSIQIATQSYLFPALKSNTAPPDDPGRFIESTCYVDELKISSSPSNLTTCVIGRVVDRDGSPVEGATVVARYPESTATISSTTTGQDGTYCLRVPAGSTILIYATQQVAGQECWSEHPLYINTQTKETSCNQDDCQPVEDVILDCEDHTCIDGRVVDEYGNPISRAEVTARLLEDTAPISTAFTDTDGYYCMHVPTNATILVYAMKQIGETQYWLEHPLYLTTQLLFADCVNGVCQTIGDLVIIIEPDGGGDFFGWTDGSDPEHLYTMVHIDGSTGAITDIGGFGSFSSLCYDRNGNLYGVETGVSLIDPQTGDHTQLFSFDYSGQSDIFMHEAAIAEDGTLYVHDVSDRIFTVSLASGDMTHIGNRDSAWIGLAFGPDGQLYGSFANLAVLDSLDGSTITPVGEYSGEVISNLSSWPSDRLFGMDESPSTTIWEINYTNGDPSPHVTPESPGITCFVPEYIAQQ